MAARITIVEVEHAIVPVGELDPDQIHVPGVYVDRLVRIPPEGIWD
jgi:3-oxoacid CoA-transferase subunit A